MSKKTFVVVSDKENVLVTESRGKAILMARFEYHQKNKRNVVVEIWWLDRKIDTIDPSLIKSQH